MTKAQQALNKVRNEGRKAGRRLEPKAREVAAQLTTLVPQPVRSQLYPVLPWRPRQVQVPLNDLLLGVMGPQTATEFAHASGRLLWPSTRLQDGPHVRLLRDVDARGALDDSDILAHEYGQMAQDCLRLHGRYFWAEDEEGIIEVARDFIARYRGEQPHGPRRPHQSAAGAPVLVAPVRWSETYQIIDGHHRAAIALCRGERTQKAKVKWIPVTTPLQDLLNEMSWIGGQKELYQPIEAPELARAWTVVRACTDRLAKMEDLLDAEGITGAGRRYLDVACCYAWFPAQMQARGFEAEGVERDPLAPTLAQAVYGFDPARVRVGDAVELLAESEQPWDVVSCFSLLHHFVLGRADVSAEVLVQTLDRVTGSVLFIDTGQDDEAWFADSLKGWDPARIRAFLQTHTTFEEIIDLGPDHDGVGAYRGNYGRHLFACIRRSTP